MKAFLSHNSKDKDFASEISFKLIEQGIDVWLDKWEIFAGESLIDKISNGIKEVNVFIIIMTANSMNSNWVKEELRMALNKRLQSPDFKIIPILYEPCVVHEFLKGYVYIDWMDKKIDGFSELIKSIKKISLKPHFDPEYPNVQIQFERVDYLVEIGGKYGERADFVEIHSAIALKDINVIDRSLHSEGKIAFIELKGMQLKREKPNSYLEKWQFIPEHTIKKGDKFSYELRYTLEHGFSEGNNFWDYSIQAPTDFLHVQFKFLLSNVTDFRILHRVGMTLSQEPTRHQHIENKYVWDKIVPAYKDTYEFHFKINNVAQSVVVR
jgi:hypothetical protein